MNRERFEEAIVAFREVLNEWGRFVGCDVEAAFYLAVSLGQAREKEEALVAAQRFLDDYPDAPERYKLAMEQMKNELMREWESPLYDLSGRMSQVARRIENGDTGDETRGKQGEIVEIIDELIRRAQQQEGNQGQGGQGGQGQGQPNASNPANRSEARRGEGGTGDLRPNTPPKAGEKWGQMRDKEREEVAMAASERPDLILMDLSLPVMDGWAATQAIKAAAETRAIPVIALSAHAMSGDREKALQAGCDDYDSKPVDLARLLAKIEALLPDGDRG